MGSGASKKISCPVCGKVMKSDIFSEHFRTTHHLKCGKCGLFGFENETVMHKHYDEVHNSQTSTKEIACPKCPAKLKTEADFLGHMSDVHFFLAKDSVVKNLSCPECGKEVTNEASLVTHTRNFHTLAEQQQRNSSGNIKCPINCTKQFSNEDQFVQHLADTHNFSFVINKTNELPQNSQCPNCDLVVPSYKELVIHMQNFHVGDAEVSMEIVCPKCPGDETFVSKEELLVHLKEDHDFVYVDQNNNDIDGGGEGLVIPRKKEGLPKVGDKILAMWSVSMWQYFHATIRRVMPDRITYEVDWDDGDTTGCYTDGAN